MNIKSMGDYVEAIKKRQNLSLQPTGEAIVSKPLVGKLFDAWYRGESNSSWSLRPKVFRKKYNERDLTNRFRALSRSRHSITPHYQDYGLFLSLMQHYGLPTRLLDWSTSPLVALYFAIERYIYEPNAEPTDASIWILNPYALNQIQIEEPTTPSIEGWSVRKYLRGAFTNFQPCKKNNDDYLDEGNDKVCAVLSAENDSRIFAQQGCFTVHTTANPFENVAVEKGFLDRIILPAASVRSIAAEMLLCGFRKSTLFPDLTNLSIDLSLRQEV